MPHIPRICPTQLHHSHTSPSLDVPSTPTQPSLSPTHPSQPSLSIPWWKTRYVKMGDHRSHIWSHCVPDACHRGDTTTVSSRWSPHLIVGHGRVKLELKLDQYRPQNINFGVVSNPHDYIQCGRIKVLSWGRLSRWSPWQITLIIISSQPYSEVKHSFTRCEHVNVIANIMLLVYIYIYPNIVLR